MLGAPSPFGRRKRMVRVDLVLEAGEKRSSGRLGVGGGVDARVEDVRCHPGP